MSLQHHPGHPHEQAEHIFPIQNKPPLQGLLLLQYQPRQPQEHDIDVDVDVVVGPGTEVTGVGLVVGGVGGTCGVKPLATPTQSQVDVQ